MHAGVMYTCDAFGLHYCAEEIFDTQLDALSPHYRCAHCEVVFLSVSRVRALVCSLCGAAEQCLVEAHRSAAMQPDCMATAALLSADQLVCPHRFYYDCLMRPNSRSVLTALRKVKDLPYTTIANGHGPIIRHNLEELVGRCWPVLATQGSLCQIMMGLTAYQTLSDGCGKTGELTLTSSLDVGAACMHKGRAVAAEQVWAAKM